MAKVTVKNVKGSRNIVLRHSEQDEKGKQILLPDILIKSGKREGESNKVAIEKEDLARYLKNKVNAGFFDSGELAVVKEKADDAG